MNIVAVHDIYKPLQEQSIRQEFDTVAALRVISRMDKIEAQQVVLKNVVSNAYPERTSGRVVDTNG